MKKLLNITEVSEYLGVPKGTVRYWCFTRKLRHYKIGKHLKFKENDLEEFLNSNLVEEGN